MIPIIAMLAAGASPDMAIGRWQTETRGGVVEIARCGRSICGRVIDSPGLRAKPDARDANNRNSALRSRPIKGMPMLAGFTWQGGAWSGGTVYNAADGGTYKATVTPVDGDHLKLKGCIVWPLCKTQSWTRMR